MTVYVVLAQYRDRPAAFIGAYNDFGEAKKAAMSYQDNLKEGCEECQIYASSTGTRPEEVINTLVFSAT